MNYVVKVLNVKVYQSTVPGKGNNHDESEIIEAGLIRGHNMFYREWATYLESFIKDIPLSGLQTSV